MFGARPGFTGTVSAPISRCRMLVRRQSKAARTSRAAAGCAALPFPDAALNGAARRLRRQKPRGPGRRSERSGAVLKPGTRFVILEFATPRFAPLRALYLFYFRHILPAVVRMVSKHRDAYTYLPESVLAFPEPEALARRFAAAGFPRRELRALTGGICAVHHGTR